MRIKKVSYCFIVLFLFIFAFSQAVFAERGRGSGSPGFGRSTKTSWSYKIFKVEPHDKWEYYDFFKRGEGTIKDAELYAHKFEVSGKNYKVEKFGIVFRTKNVRSENISNIRLVIDKNDNGVIDTDETATIGGPGILARGLIIFKEPFAVIPSNDLSLILVADLKGLTKGAFIHLEIDEKFFLVFYEKDKVVEETEDESGNKSEDKAGEKVEDKVEYEKTTITKGKTITVQFSFDKPMAAVELYTMQRKIVNGQKVRLEGMLYYHLGNEPDEEYLRNLKIPGWITEEVVFGPVQGKSYHHRDFYMVLVLDKDNSAEGEKSLPPFRVKFFDKVKRADRFALTPEFKFINSPFYFTVDYFPHAVGIGDIIRYRIEGILGDMVDIPDAFLNKFRDIQIVDFKVSGVEISKESVDGYKKVIIDIFMSYVKLPGKAIPVKGLNISYTIIGAAGQEIKTYKVPTIAVGTNFITVKDDRFRFIDKSAGLEDVSWYLRIGTIKTVRLTFFAGLIMFFLWYPIRFAIAFYGRQSAVNEKTKIKQAFWSLQTGIQDRSNWNEDAWEEYFLGLNRYLKEFFPVNAEINAIGFGAALKAVMPANLKSDPSGARKINFYECWNKVSAICFAGVDKADEQKIAEVLNTISHIVKQIENRK